jgi:hypothetical protein
VPWSLIKKDEKFDKKSWDNVKKFHEQKLNKYRNKK